MEGTTRGHRTVMEGRPDFYVFFFLAQAAEGQVMADSVKTGMSVDDVAGSVNRDVARLITGQSVPVHTVDFKRKDAMLFKPKTKGNVCYIVMVVLFNEHDQVLLVQEAKESCRGSWYLPAGRLEPNETFVTGAKREVEEEAGLTCDMVTMLSFHFGSSRWMRLNFLGRITGGKLKTLSEQDEESLQAQFFDVASVFNGKVHLRNGDILAVIRQAMEYRDSMKGTPPAPLHPVLQPVTAPHSMLLHRFLLVVDTGQESGLLMLAGCEGEPHIVTCAIAPNDPSLFITVHSLIRTALAGETLRPTLHGVVGLEHNGVERGQDGMCLTTLVSLSSSSPAPKEQGPPTLRNEDFVWVPLTDPACRTCIQEGMRGHLCKMIEK